MGKNKSQFGFKILICCLITGLTTTGIFFPQNSKILAQENVGELNSEIGQKQKEIDLIQQQIDEYEAKIAAKKKEARGLQNQLAIIQNQIAKLELDIQATEKKIEQTDLEIQSLNLQIKQKENEIAEQKNKLAEYIRLIQHNDQVSYLEVMMMNHSFSDFFDYLKYIEEIHSDVKKTLDNFKNSKHELETQKLSMEDKKKQEEELKNDLAKRKSEVEEKLMAQQIVLIQTKLTERQYQNYLYQSQLEQQQINSEIITLEKKVREELERREKDKLFQDFGPARLGWPLDPSRGITAYFHDPDYPFRYIFEHPAIDIRAYQGTPIKAPEGGYVAKIQFRGDTSYAYIMLIHNDGLSTVFGHVSAVYVQQDEYVTKGQTIGLSGGAPGTKGAGNLSTGPHLHFEVRLNGIPVNPLEYLPAF